MTRPGTRKGRAEKMVTNLEIQTQTLTDRNGKGHTGTDRDIHGQTGTDRDRQGQKGSKRDRQGQTGTDKDRQKHKGTCRDRKGLSLLFFKKKHRDKTGIQPAEIEQGQNRDKKIQIWMEKIYNLMFVPVLYLLDPVLSLLSLFCPC